MLERACVVNDKVKKYFTFCHSHYILLVMETRNTLFDLRPRHPGKNLRDMMESKGWTQDEMATITGMSRQTINNLIAGKTNITPEVAVKLAAVFKNNPEEWLKWDNIFRLSQLEGDTSSVGKLARIYEIAPVRDMQRRGWIQVTGNPAELEAELAKFYGENPIESEVRLQIAARRALTLTYLNPAEKAWCFRAKQLARMLPIRPFNVEMLSSTEERLRQLAASPKECRHISKVLASAGIKFVVIEPLPGSQIDGATLWMESNPVIAVSLRHDRIDGFWFTLMHEFAHVVNGDASVDVDLFDGVRGVAVRLVEDDAEHRANEQSAGSLVPKAELDSFIRRVGPLYPRERVIQFANKVKIHPGIIVGQLQYRKEIGYSALRPFLVKVRDNVTSTSLTDGWNQIVPQM
jgi:HTH-type transcriptional regulator / antitoxin HigA